MAKYCGKIGYAVSEETSPGVWEEKITEREYYGELIKNTRKLANGENLNDDITVANDVSIVADPFAMEHFNQIRYAVLYSDKWKVSDVEVKSPRLILRLGGVYNG
mgnify:FL=1